MEEQAAGNLLAFIGAVWRPYSFQLLPRRFTDLQNRLKPLLYTQVRNVQFVPVLSKERLVQNLNELIIFFLTSSADEANYFFENKNPADVRVASPR